MRIVIVEDNKTNLMIMTRLASHAEGVTVAPFENPRQALDDVRARGCDLLVLDYLMPEINGLEFIRRFRENPATLDVPVVMITSENDRTVRSAAIEAGATDFLTKPVDPVEIRARIRNLLLIRRAAIRERGRSNELQTAIVEATRIISEREREMVLRLTRAIELRDGETGSHVERLANMARSVARTMGLEASEVEDIFLASPMHDIGKLAVPDAILCKPGPLTPEERAIMQQHTTYGHAILDGSKSHLLRKAATIALSHHERIDGRGYPHGLKGEQIPLEARIVAVVDVYDALVSRRVYKPAWSVADARQYLIDNSGSHFDARCVEAFLALPLEDGAAAEKIGDKADLLAAAS